MKRQTSTTSSSSRRENAPAPEKIHAKTIGCMSGILHLLSNSNSFRNRRFLTFGKKQVKNHADSDSPVTVDSEQREDSKEEKIINVDDGNKLRLSCEIPRSPTLPAEIRRSNPVKPSPPPGNRRDPPALVVRLMGLEEFPTTVQAQESVEEKRERLLGALQKCDEDLKALKKIIEAVRSVDPPHLPPVVSRSGGWCGDKIKAVSEVKCSVVNDEQLQQQQPSPVSVLNEFTRSPLSPSCNSGRYSFGRMQPHKQQLLKKPGEDEMSSTYIYERMTSELVHTKGKVVEEGDDDSSAMWSSKAMIKSVEEVCRDIAWGEKREVGKIGLALQDYICRELIEEIARELGCLYTLPFEACKRRLCF